MFQDQTVYVAFAPPQGSCDNTSGAQSNDHIVLNKLVRYVENQRDAHAACAASVMFCHRCQVDGS